MNKKITFSSGLTTKFAIAIIFLLAGSVYAKKHIVSVSSNQFSPQTFSNVVVGDTIRWVWVNGTHNTNSIAQSIPANAKTWSADINAGSTSFEYKVEVAGNYGYFCSFHGSLVPPAGMIGGFSATAPTGIAQAGGIQANLSIFPKPAKDLLNVNFNANANETGIVRIYDIQGREVQKEEADLSFGSNALQFSIANLNSGLYFVEVYANKRKVGLQKLIKE